MSESHTSAALYIASTGI